LTAFKDTFLQRFGRSAARRWNDANMLWTEKEGEVNVDDYVTKITQLAKRLPDLDESMLRHAIIRGLKPHIRSHVLQADVKTMAELLHAARVAEMASSAADTQVSGALEELSASSKQQLTADSVPAAVRQDQQAVYDAARQRHTQQIRPTTTPPISAPRTFQRPVQPHPITGSPPFKLLRRPSPTTTSAVVRSILQTPASSTRQLYVQPLR